jgi:hypothetical protein
MRLTTLDKLNKETCKCNNVAVWDLLSAREGEECYFCDDCVPRGCSCNHNQRFIPTVGNNMPTEEDGSVIWLDENTWTWVDEQGRELPCCEYHYQEEGFETEND